VDNTNVKVPQSIKMSYIYKQQQHQQQQHKNNLTPLKINSNSSDLPPPHEDSGRKNTDDSCSTTMSSPISSINGSSLVSPQSSNTINTVQNIPTRFIDRRISASALPVDPHKFNVKYSEVGQKIAQKAQEALKKTKDVDAANDAIIHTVSKRSEHVENGNGSGSGSGGGSASDDWQNVSF